MRCDQCFELLLTENPDPGWQLLDRTEHAVTVITPLLFPVGWIDVIPALPFERALGDQPVILSNVSSQGKRIFKVFDIDRPDFSCLWGMPECKLQVVTIDARP